MNKLSKMCGFWQILYTIAIGVKLDFRMLRGRGKKGHCTLYSIQLKLNLFLKRESNKQKQRECCWGLKGVFQVADAAQLTRASLKCWSEKEEKEEEATLALPTTWSQRLTLDMGRIQVHFDNVDFSLFWKTRLSNIFQKPRDKEEEALLARPLGVKVLDSHSHQIWVDIFIFKYILIMLTFVFFLEN